MSVAAAADIIHWRVPGVPSRGEPMGFYRTVGSVVGDATGGRAVITWVGRSSYLYRIDKVAWLIGSGGSPSVFDAFAMGDQIGAFDSSIFSYASQGNGAKRSTGASGYLGVYVAPVETAAVPYQVAQTQMDNEDGIQSFQYLYGVWWDLSRLRKDETPNLAL